MLNGCKVVDGRLRSCSQDELVTSSNIQVSQTFTIIELPKFSKCRHTNISFTIESEEKNRMFFIDVHIIREDKKVTTSQFSTKYLDYADYLVIFELFYRNIRNLGISSNEDLDFVKTRTKEAALSSYLNYNKQCTTTSF